METHTGWRRPSPTGSAGWSGKDIDGAILVNAETGESKWYAKADVPQWIDQLYDSNLIMEQLDDNGRFQNGYLNSIFGHAACAGRPTATTISPSTTMCGCTPA